MDDAYRLVATPKFEFPYQVVRSDGLPDVPLTLFAREQLQSLSASSVPLYLREIVAFLNWSESDPVVQRYQWRIDESPTEVRNMLREYLTVAAKCKLTSRADGLGVKATYVVQTAGNTINIRTLLAALKRLFEMLIARGMYHHPNPLLHEEAALRNIEADATSETDLRRRKEELIQYMAWKTGERTLAAYEHVQRREQFLDTLTAIHHKMARRSKQRPSALSLPRPSELIATISPAAVDQDLCLLTGKYDDN